MHAAMLNLINAASLGFASTPTALVDGVYAGAFPAPDSGGALEFPFFLVFGENYGTLYMYGDKSGWCAPPLLCAPSTTHASAS